MAQMASGLFCTANRPYWPNRNVFIFNAALMLCILFLSLVTLQVSGAAAPIHQTVLPPGSHNADAAILDQILPLDDFSLTLLDILHPSGRPVSISSLSSSAPWGGHSDDFILFPFGHKLQLMFTVNGTTYDFTLDVDTLAGRVGTRADAYFTKHNSFSGSRFDQNGNIEMVYLTFSPNSGQLQEEQLASARTSGNGYATQSVATSDHQQASFAPLSMSPQSGRHQDGMTARITLMLANGHVFHIHSINTMRFQSMHASSLLQSEINTMRQEHSTMSTASVEHDVLSEQISVLSAKMSILDHQMVTLAQTQSNAAYDMALFVHSASTDNGGMLGSCGAHEHSHQNHHRHTTTAQKQNPSSQFAPQWNLSPWTTCHSRNATSTILFMDLYLAYSFQLYASESSTTASQAKALTEAQHQIALVNTYYYPQLGIAWRIKSVEYGDDTDTDAWNPLSPTDSKCSTLTDNMDQARQSTSGASAMLMIIATCSSSGIVGTATIGATCNTQVGVGWSSATGYWAYRTIAHEAGHNINAEHPFYDKAKKADNLTLAGTFGGIMDYYNTRLPDTISYTTDKRFYGFNYDTDSQWFCSYLDDVWNGLTGLESTAASNCWSSLSESTCGNSIVEPWEECDTSNSCCSSCRLTTGATCATSDSTCCVNCVAQPASTLCDTSYGTNTGFCNAGTCEPIPVTDDSTYTYLEACPSVTLQAMDNCMFAYATSSSCDSASLSSVGYAPLGALCTTTSGASGICMPNEVFSDDNDSSDQYLWTKSYICDTSSVNSYSWKLNTIATCVCNELLNTYTAAVETYTCHNAGGVIVAQSFCSSLTVPAASYCACADKISSDDYSWVVSATGTCQGTCGTGNQTRTIVCENNSGSVVADSSCSADTKPSTTVSCTLPSDSCGSHGTCEQDTSGDYECSCTNGWSGTTCTTSPCDQCQYGTKCNSSQQCECPSGFYGDYCQTGPSWELASASACFGNCSDGGVTYSPLSCVDPETSLHLPLSQCSYISTTAPTTIASCTPTTSCENGSTCDSQSSTCSCSTGFSGLTCAEDACDECVSENTQSCSASGGCVCNSGFTGTLCDEPTACASALKCKNSGFVSYLDSNDTSQGCASQCTCQNSFTPASNCAACGLSSYHGKPNTDCSALICNSGYYGEDCSCEELYLSITFVNAPDVFYDKSSGLKTKTTYYAPFNRTSLLAANNTAYAQVMTFLDSVATVAADNSELCFNANSTCSSGGVFEFYAFYAASDAVRVTFRVYDSSCAAASTTSVQSWQPTDLSGYYQNSRDFLAAWNELSTSSINLIPRGTTSANGTELIQPTVFSRDAADPSSSCVGSDCPATSLSIAPSGYSANNAAPSLIISSFITVLVTLCGLFLALW